MKRRLSFAVLIAAVAVLFFSVAAAAQQSTTSKKSTTTKKSSASKTAKASKTSTAKTQTKTAEKKAMPDVVTLKAPNGDVKFSHTAHAKERAIKCETCHHPSKPEKPLKAAQERCSDCHTRTVTPPMKTKLQAAFHNPTATAGTCIDCHKAENAKGKKAPTKCQECHKKAAA